MNFTLQTLYRRERNTRAHWQGDRERQSRSRRFGEEKSLAYTDYIIHSCSALETGLAGTRAQSYYILQQNLCTITTEIVGPVAQSV